MNKDLEIINRIRKKIDTKRNETIELQRERDEITNKIDRVNTDVQLMQSEIDTILRGLVTEKMWYPNIKWEVIKTTRGDGSVLLKPLNVVSVSPEQKKWTEMLDTLFEYNRKLFFDTYFYIDDARTIILEKSSRFFYGIRFNHKFGYMLATQFASKHNLNVKKWN